MTYYISVSTYWPLFVLQLIKFRFALASHFLWGLWSIIQAKISKIEFGYMVNYTIAYIIMIFSLPKQTWHHSVFTVKINIVYRTWSLHITSLKSHHVTSFRSFVFALFCLFVFRITHSTGLTHTSNRRNSFLKLSLACKACTSHSASCLVVFNETI